VQVARLPLPPAKICWILLGDPSSER